MCKWFGDFLKYLPHLSRNTERGFRSRLLVSRKNRNPSSFYKLRFVTHRFRNAKVRSSDAFVESQHPL